MLKFNLFNILELFSNNHFKSLSAYEPNIQKIKIFYIKLYHNLT